MGEFKPSFDMNFYILSTGHSLTLAFICEDYHIMKSAIDNRRFGKCQTNLQIQQRFGYFIILT